MNVSLGSEFEQAIITAAGIQDLNIDPGSLHLGPVNDPMTTVRFTLVVDVPGDVVREAIVQAIQPKEV